MMKSKTNLRVVFITTDSFENARHISRILINEKLAACCSLIPNCHSIYEWEEQIKENYEFLIIIKTSKDKLHDLEQRVTELHSYDVPEIIAMPVDFAAVPYMQWVNNVLK